MNVLTATVVKMVNFMYVLAQFEKKDLPQNGENNCHTHTRTQSLLKKSQEGHSPALSSKCGGREPHTAQWGIPGSPKATSSLQPRPAAALGQVAPVRPLKARRPPLSPSSPPHRFQPQLRRLELEGTRGTKRQCLAQGHKAS